MAIYEAEPQAASGVLPIGVDTYREFAALYRWQNRSGIDISGSLDGEPETHFALQFYGGEDYPTYKLRLAEPDRPLRTIRFFTYQLGPVVFIAPLQTEKHPDSSVTEEDIMNVCRIIPSALAEKQRIEAQRPKRRWLPGIRLRLGF